MSEKIRDALEWYGNAENYVRANMNANSDADRDEGTLAREALAELDAGAPESKESCFLAEAADLARRMHSKFGPHDSAEFAVCRIAEEVGELAQAATAMSKGRDKNRGPRIREEALDSVAMILRLLNEFPLGRAELDAEKPPPEAHADGNKCPRSVKIDWGFTCGRGWLEIDGVIVAQEGINGISGEMLRRIGEGVPFQEPISALDMSQMQTLLELKASLVRATGALRKTGESHMGVVRRLVRDAEKPEFIAIPDLGSFSTSEQPSECGTCGGTGEKLTPAKHPFNTGIHIMGSWVEPCPDCAEESEGVGVIASEAERRQSFVNSLPEGAVAMFSEPPSAEVGHDPNCDAVELGPDLRLSTKPCNCGLTPNAEPPSAECERCRCLQDEIIAIRKALNLSSDDTSTLNGVLGLMEHRHRSCVACGQASGLNETVLLVRRGWIHPYGCPDMKDGEIPNE